MTLILNQLPFREEEDEVQVGSQRVPIKAYQIVVWVSVAVWRVMALPPHSERFPAIIDTGHNHHFSIRSEQLTEWARQPVDSLQKIGAIRVGGKRLPLHAAHLWIHPNRPGERDQFSGASPHRLVLDEGIAIYPEGSAFPPLPTIGVRALVRNKLHFAMDPERCMVNLLTPDWRTKLLSWLW